MNNLFAIFIGGGIGSILRYLLSIYIKSPANHFPLATFSANTLAGLLLGLVSGFILTKYGDSHWLFYLLGIGLCGGFSTFSTFSLESIRLFQSNQIFLVLSYIILSILCCVGAIFLGIYISKSL